MRIELTPSGPGGSKDGFTARFTRESEVVAEIIDAPADIAARWAEAMKAVHGNKPEIKRLGICFYCGSTELEGKYCGSCQRVVRA